MQNNAAHVVLRKKKRDPLLKKLHRLPVTSRIEFKVCLLTCKASNGLAPPCLAALLTRYGPTRSLRSGAQDLLSEEGSQIRKKWWVSF